MTKNILFVAAMIMVGSMQAIPVNSPDEATAACFVVMEHVRVGNGSDAARLYEDKFCGCPSGYRAQLHDELKKVTNDAVIYAMLNYFDHASHSAALVNLREVKFTKEAYNARVIYLLRKHGLEQVGPDVKPIYRARSVVSRPIATPAPRPEIPAALGGPSVHEPVGPRYGAVLSNEELNQQLEQEHIVNNVGNFPEHISMPASHEIAWRRVVAALVVALAGGAAVVRYATAPAAH